MKLSNTDDSGRKSGAIRRRRLVNLLGLKSVIRSFMISRLFIGICSNACSFVALHHPYVDEVIVRLPTASNYAAARTLPHYGVSKDSCKLAGKPR